MMKPAIRTPVDERQSEFSFLTGLDTSDLPDLARQEFREQTDTNYILDRFGVQTPMQRTPQFGEVDWDLDLHSAHISVERVQAAWYELDPELREKYKNSAGLLDAMNSGELQKDLEARAREKALAKREADEDLSDAAKEKLAAKKAAKAASTPKDAGSPPDLTSIIPPAPKAP